MKRINYKKYTNWEYWPSFMFYLPVVPYALYLALKSRSFGFFSAVNPAIEGSGNGLESKYKTLELVPEKYKPKSIYIKTGDKISTILPKLVTSEISFPAIIKPDIGFRGLLVKKVNSKSELIEYINKYNSINLILQEYIELKNECGIFYHRMPDKKTGVITSITLKKYLTVTGNGSSTILELLKTHERGKIYIPLISELNKNILHKIPQKNKETILNVIGNHSKGTQFINGNNLINKKLTDFLDVLSNNIDGWFYGRVDFKYNDFNELCTGENLKIIEINGIISEPTHIYDASKGSYFKAIKSIKNHWKILATIGMKNKRANNAKYTNLNYLLHLYIRFKAYLKKVKSLSTN